MPITDKTTANGQTVDNRIKALRIAPLLRADGKPTWIKNDGSEALTGEVECPKATCPVTGLTAK
jgi:hypothetical protein